MSMGAKCCKKVKIEVHSVHLANRFLPILIEQLCEEVDWMKNEGEDKVSIYYFLRELDY